VKHHLERGKGAEEPTMFVRLLHLLKENVIFRGRFRNKRPFQAVLEGEVEEPLYFWAEIGLIRSDIFGRGK
jgi:hypothetical protein